MLTLFREKVFKALGLRSMYLQNCSIYLRVNVIGAQDVEPSDRSQPPQAFVKVQPFEEQFFLTVENKVSSAKDEVMGRLISPLNVSEKRLDHRAVHSKWYNLQNFGFGALEGETRDMRLKFSSRMITCEFFLREGTI
ncbi:hypothetical protein YC2023_034101 [Brassica napus]